MVGCYYFCELPACFLEVFPASDILDMTAAADIYEFFLAGACNCRKDGSTLGCFG